MHSVQFEIHYILEMSLRLFAACVLGGIIGFEREFPEHRPAGFRTHILVCLGAALVMVTSEYLNFIYGSALDITRIGAQVVSGIGFLGAGAIIKQGFNVTGLTTAASLWAVACVGLACGAGFYTGAVIATIFIYIVLQVLKNVKLKFEKHIDIFMLTVEINGNSNLLGEITEMIEKNNLLVKNMVMSKNENNQKQIIRCTLEDHEGMIKSKDELLEEINALEGVVKVYY